MKILKNIALALLLMLSTNAFSYITAADLTYTCQGNGYYTFTLKVYAECASDNIYLQNARSQVLIVESEKLGIDIQDDITIELNAVKFDTYKILCENRPIQCNGGDERGLQIGEYRGSFSFFGLQKTDDWRVHWTKNYRSRALNSTFSVTDQPYYVETFIDNQNITCNSSPVYQNSPIVAAIVGEENIYNPLVSDPDGDELRFRLANPRTGENTDLSLLPGFSVSRPFSSSSNISIDNKGVIKFTPIKAGEQTIVDVIVSEYRGGNKISETSRALQFNTFDDDNTVPVISGFNGGTSFDTTFCVGDIVTPDALFIEGTDIDTDLQGADKQNLIFKVFGKYAGKTQISRFGNNLKLGFSWVFTDADEGSHTITVKLKDDGCPVPREIIKEFTINVIASPKFELGPDFFLNCDNPEVLNPTVTGGGGIYKYKWTNWYIPINSRDTVFTDPILEGSPSFVTNKPQKVTLIVEDQFGCSNYDCIDLKKSINSNLTIDKWCVGLPTELTNNASSQHGAIVSRTWDFGDGTSSFADFNFKQTHTYAAGKYEASVITEDLKGCVDTAIYEVEMCSTPQFNFEIKDSCNNSYFIIDKTDYSNGCNFLEVTSNRSEYFPPDRNRGIDDWHFYFSVKPIIGDFPFSANAKLLSGCVIDSSFNLSAINSPSVSLEENGVDFDNYSLICDDPDTTLKAVLRDTGNGGIDWEWFYFLPDAPKLMRYKNSNKINDSTFFTDFGATFWVQVEDAKGCFSNDSAQILDLIVADYAYELVCDSGNPVNFVDSTIIGLANIDSYEWDFGDNNSSSLENPSHTYAAEGDYDVTLTVSDINGCTDQITQKVYYTFPKGDITLYTDPKNVVLCAKNDTIIASIPETAHPDTIKWNQGTLKSRVYTGFNVVNGEYIDDMTFDQDGTFLVSLDLSYNFNPGVAIGRSCQKRFESDSVLEIKPALSGYLDVYRLCVGDSAEFTFNQTAGAEIVDWHWVFYPRVDPSDILYDTIAEQPKLVFDEDFDLDFHVNITDDIGCNIYVAAPDILLVEENPVAFTELSDIPCLNEYAEVEIKVNDSKASIREWYVYDQQTKDFIPPNPNNPDIINITYIPGALEQYSIEDGLFRYKFSKPGKNVITIYMSGQVGAQRECRSLLHDTVYVADIPRPSFIVDSAVCAEDELTLVNTSTVAGAEKITSYLWTFPDGSTSTDTNAKHTFSEGGNQPVSLVANGTNCSDTLWNESVYIKHKPVADYWVDEDNLEAFVPIDFEDRSESVTELVRSYYDFGDGDTSNLFDDSHQYESIEIYNVMHHVTTVEGCSDTIIKSTDLNVYLDIPTAFTPNGDGNNDDIGLIHKQIKDLQEYKIYNRWGQVVFDGGADPDARWDGKFKNTDQEFGVYVVIVKGFGAYDTQFEFKKNITLIR